MYGFYDLACDAVQCGVKIFDYFLGYRLPEYICGRGFINRLPEMLRDKGAGKVLLVTEKALIDLGTAKKLLDPMDEAGIDYVLFTDVEQNPTSDNVEAGFNVFRENKCESVVALGGGAPMDCAKAVCAKAAHPRMTTRQLHGILRVHKRVPLLFAVPTTSGTGSETTLASVITDSKTRRKASINDPVLIPKYAVLDPELTLTMPPGLTATTGMDALCHAVEAYTNHFYNTPVENIMAVRAVKLIYDNLYMAYKDGSDIEARENMQIAALYAGRAFTRGCVGYVHAIGHTMGGLYGVPHGKAMAILLPHVMRAFGPKVHRRLAELADACGITGKSEAEKAEKFISWIEDMKRLTGIPEKLDMIKDEDIDQIITWAMREANPLYPTPVLWKRGDFRKFIDSVRA